jgi:hypothetical protein
LKKLAPRSLVPYNLVCSSIDCSKDHRFRTLASYNLVCSSIDCSKDHRFRKKTEKHSALP